MKYANHNGRVLLNTSDNQIKLSGDILVEEAIITIRKISKKMKILLRIRQIFLMGFSKSRLIDMYATRIPIVDGTTNEVLKNFATAKVFKLYKSVGV